MSRTLAAALSACLLAACAGPGGAGGDNSVPDAGSASADKRAAIRLELAKDYYQRGDFDVALSDVNESLSLAPRYEPAYVVRGLIHLAQRRADLAEADLRRAIELKSDDADAMHDLGVLLCGRGDYAGAYAQFGAALAVPGYVNAPRTDLAYGMCQIRGGDLPGADRTLHAGFAIAPADPAMATNLALVLFREGRFSDAAFYISRVNSSPGVRPESIWIGLLVARAAGDAVTMSTLTDALVQRFPDSAQAIAAQQGRFDDPSLLPR